MKKIGNLMLLGAMIFSLSGCQKSSGTLDEGTGRALSSVTAETRNTLEEVTEAAVPLAAAVSERKPAAQSQPAVIYIGMGENFREFPIQYAGELSPELLIEQMSALTGWNLDLADEVSMGKSGMTVCFAETCALFTGPPKEQKEDFFVYDAAQLANIILDSIKHTLQYNYGTPELGDPSALEIYYSMEGDKPLALEPLGVTLPLGEPYNGLPWHSYED